MEHQAYKSRPALPGILSIDPSRFELGEFTRPPRYDRPTDPACERDLVRRYIWQAFPHLPREEAERMARDAVWDSICACWIVHVWQTTIGIELDGYVHS